MFYTGRKQRKHLSLLFCLNSFTSCIEQQFLTEAFWGREEWGKQSADHVLAPLPA